MSYLKLKRRIAVLVLLSLFSMEFVSMRSVYAYSKLKGVCSISNTTIRYKDNIDDEYRECGGYRKIKKIRLSKKAKFYWYRPGNSRLYKRISKKKFLKWIKYRYRIENKKYSGTAPSTEIHKLCTFKVKNGKVIKVYAEYCP